MSNDILSLVGAFFVILAAFHWVKALKAPIDPSGDWSIAKKVRLKLAIIFGIVGIALLGLHYLLG
jgi:hypothetical protein